MAALGSMRRDGPPQDREQVSLLKAAQAADNAMGLALRFLPFYRMNTVGGVSGADVIAMLEAARLQMPWAGRAHNDTNRHSRL